MVKGCGGHSTMDALFSRHRTMVCDCVAKESQFLIPSSMDTVGMVLVGYCWCTISNRT